MIYISFFHAAAKDTSILANSFPSNVPISHQPTHETPHSQTALSGTTHSLYNVMIPTITDTIHTAVHPHRN